MADFNVSRYLDYREIIKKIAKSRRVSFKSLAASCHIHSSYFSRVMSMKADFSQEQLFLICKDLNLLEWETEYILLLGEHSSTGNSQHRQYLRGKIEEVRDERGKVIKEMEEVETEFSEEHVDNYYREAVTAMVHMLLTIEKFRKSPTLICGKILISEQKLEMEMNKLETLGIIRRSSGGIEIVKYSVHLDETHHASPMNHINWRLNTINYLSKRTPRPTDYHLSAVFSTDEAAKIRIKEMFKQFVVAAQKETAVKRSNEDVYHIAFDLY